MSLSSVVASAVASLSSKWAVVSSEVVPLVVSVLGTVKDATFSTSTSSGSIIGRVIDACDGYDALTVSLGVCLLFIYYSFTWSIIGNNCSKVDQIWSITPVVYAWLFYYLDGTKNERVLTMAVLITMWGARLTFNFWRRGGYGNLIVHEEDYRWPILRQQINNDLLFYLFNLTFIASYQNLLLWFICLPVYEVAKQGGELLLRDRIVAVLFVVLLGFETIADQQQWNFQNYKYSFSPPERARHSNKDVVNGFLTTGLFTYTRHPNYFCEQSIWVVVYLFSTNSSDASLVNWTIFGVIQLIALFAGSMSFSEGITAKKYPAYLTYQKKVSQCIPIPFFFINDKKNK